LEITGLRSTFFLTTVTNSGVICDLGAQKENFLVSHDCLGSGIDSILGVVESLGGGKKPPSGKTLTSSSSYGVNAEKLFLVGIGCDEMSGVDKLSLIDGVS